MARRGTFAFDLSKPLRTGMLLKQGAFHKAFKSRAFVLYPGFLVYYESEAKWRLDLAKGETLGGRLGAVKLKGATVGIARNAPKACKFGIMLDAPDPANKRQVYVVNANSKEDRDSWIEAIRKATPTSPHMKRKDLPKCEEKPVPKSSEAPPKKPSESPSHQDSQKSSGGSSSLSNSQGSSLPPPPAYTERQNTACDAAVAAAACTDPLEEQKAVDEVLSSVNSSLMEGSLRRHDTATMAAISLSEEIEAGRQQQQNGYDEEEGEEDLQPETNIDLVLGRRDDEEDDNSSRVSSSTPESSTLSPPPEFSDVPSEAPPTASDAADSEDTARPVTLEIQEKPVVAVNVITSPEPVTPDALTPTPAHATEMQTKETVVQERSNSSSNGSNSNNSGSGSGGGGGDGGGEEEVAAMVVTTTVMVACSPNTSPNLDRKEQEGGETETVAERKEGGGGGGEEDGGKNGKEELLVNGQREEVKEEVKEEGDGEGEGKRERSTSSTQILITDDEKTRLSVNLSGYETDDTLSDEDSHEVLPQSCQGVVQNGTVSAKNGTESAKNGTESAAAENGAKSSPGHSPPPKSPEIAVKEDRKGSNSSSSSDKSNNGDGNKLTPSGSPPRKSSAPFVEKKGFLYKMGGQRKTWKLRYFVLRPGAFSYYKDSRMAKALGEVKLKNLNIFFPGIGERKQSFQFTVHTESSWNKREDWVFAGQSEREMKEWIAAFKQAGRKIGDIE